MIVNNLRLSIRHLNRQKINTALHIIGLTLGMSVCLLIGLLLRYKWSFDRYHHKADQIYRVTSHYKDGNHNVQVPPHPIPLAESLRKGIAGVENVTLAHPYSTAQIGITPERQFFQNNILAVDSEILDIFDIEVIAGNGYDALLKPYHALLTETTAQIVFFSHLQVIIFKNDYACKSYLHDVALGGAPVIKIEVMLRSYAQKLLVNRLAQIAEK